MTHPSFAFTIATAPVPALARSVVPGGLLLALVLLAPALVCADSGGREQIDGDLILMQGKWKLVDFAYYRNGVVDRPPREMTKGERTVTGNRYHLKLTIPPQQVDEHYTFKLYPDQTPKGADITMPDGRVIQGIFEIKGDTLRRCYSQPGDPRPTQFQVGDQTYQRWKRVVERAAK